MAYNRQFYDNIRDGSRRSARALMPLVLELVRPKTVVDVGCGDGTWLAVLRELGVTDTLGIDGSHIDRQILQIPEGQFKSVDLAKPFRLDRVFDLAISLEVAEHLPPAAAADFVLSLIQSAPVVLFAAAIPFQGGQNHLNEQWPDYWAALFQRHDYLPIDCIRGKIWSNDQVQFWYAQNTLLFAHAPRVHRDPALLQEYQRTNPGHLALVHPRKYLAVAHPGVRAASASLCKSLKRAAGWRSGQLLHKKTNG